MLIEEFYKELTSIKPINLEKSLVATLLTNKDKPSFGNAKILNIKDNSNYDLKDKLSNYDSLLHRMFLLEYSFDNGFSHFLNFIRQELNKIEKVDWNKKISMYESEMKELQQKKSDHKEKIFYSTLNDLLNDKKQLKTNKKFQELSYSLNVLKKYATTEVNKDWLEHFLKRATLYFKTNLKPQQYKNVSFLKQVNKKKLEGKYFGNIDMIDFEDSFNNMEDTRVLNFEATGTFAIDDVKDDKQKTNKKSIQAYIHEICHYFGMIKISKEETKYILDNISLLASDLIAEKKKAILKKNPKLKDFTKMFKSEQDKNTYIEYINVVVVSSFILIFVSMNRTNIEISKLYSKCNQLFSLEGYPINFNEKNKQKSTLSYFACLIKHLYPRNKLMEDKERNMKKMVQVTDMIFNKKPELKKSMSTKKHSYQHNMNQLTSISNFKPTLEFLQSKNNECNNYIVDDLQKQSLSLPESSIMLQLKKTKRTYDDIFRTIPIVLKNSNYINIREVEAISSMDNVKQFFVDNPTYSRHVDNLLKKLDGSWREVILFVEDRLTQLKNLLKTFMTNKGQEIDSLFNIINSTFVSYKNVETEDIHLYCETLLKYIETKMMIPLSKVIHNYNDVQHTNLISKPSVKFLKKSPADREFVSKIAVEKENKQHTTLVKNINKEQEIVDKLTRIVPPKNSYLLKIEQRDIKQDDENKSKLSILLLYVMLLFCENIINSINDEISSYDDKYEYIEQSLEIDQDNMKLLCQLIYETLNTIPSMVKEQDNEKLLYKSDVEQMRELDKKNKYDLKDNMSDEERLLYINLEQVGVIPNMSEFKDLYTQPEMYSEYQNDQSFAPEYTPYVGENDDE